MNSPFKILCVLSLLLVICRPAGAQYSSTEQLSYIMPAPGLADPAILDTATITKLVSTALQVHTTFPDSAFGLLQRALSASEHRGYKWGMIRALMAIGTPYQNTGEYAKALDAYQRAIILCGNEESYRPTLINLYNNAGNIYRYKGNYTYAVEYYHLALRKIGDTATGTYGTLKARTFNNLSAVLMDMDELDKAAYYVNEGERLFRRYRNDRSLGRLLNNKGALLIRQGHYTESITALKEALTLSRSTNDKETQHLVLGNLAEIHRKQNEPAAASTYLQQAITLSDFVNPFQKVTPYISLGEIYLQEGNYTKATHYLELAMDICNKAGLPGQAAIVHRYLSRLYGATGQYDKAWRHEAQYTLLHDSLQEIEKLESINMIEAKYQSAEKDKEILQARQLLHLRQQAHQQQKMIWIISGALGLILLLSLFSLLYKGTRNKQRLLAGKIHILEQEQEIKLLRAHMDGEEMERVRIGREIHDGIGGLLSAAKIRLSTMRLNNSSLINEGDFNSALSLIDGANTELRKTAHNLLPEVILNGGLKDAITNFAGHIALGTTTELHLQFYGDIPRLDQAVELSVFRIAQELINNIIKHAHAKQALIQLNWQEAFFSISVEDDGIGFVVGNGMASDKGVGLQNIEARVKALEGTLEFESELGSGTNVYIEFNTLTLENTISIKNENNNRRHSRRS